MKVEDFKSYYDQDREDGASGGLLAEQLAYLMLPDIPTSRVIRQEVRKIGCQRCSEFTPKEAWIGTESGKWPGLKEITRQCCRTMLLLPESKNPLAKENLKQWAGDAWAGAINALGFEKRQIFLYRLAFHVVPRDIVPLLNATRPKDSRYTIRSVNAHIAEALTEVADYLVDYYTPK